MTSGGVAGAWRRSSARRRAVSACGSGRSAALCADLEDSIAVIDDELADATRAERAARQVELVQLWRERVDLMQQLVSLRVTRAAYVGL